MIIRRIARIIAGNIGLMLAGIVLVEAIFGNWFSESSLGFLNVPRNVLLKHKLSGARSDSSIAVYRKDQHGFRGRYGQPSDIDILVVGGSTTNELYVGEGSTWVDVLQAELRRYGKNWLVANGGVDGHSTIGHLRSFDLWYSKVPGLRPRYILFYIGINDVQVETHVDVDTIEPTETWARRMRFAKNNSAVYYLYQTLRGMFRAYQVRVVYRDAPPKIRIYDTASRPPIINSERLTQFDARLRALAERSRKLGATPIFVTQRRGDAYRVDGIWHATHRDAISWQIVLENFNRTTLAVCKDVRGICIDLAEKIQLQAEDFDDEVHTNAGGSRKIGLFLAAMPKDRL